MGISEMSFSQDFFFSAPYFVGRCSSMPAHLPTRKSIISWGCPTNYHTASTLSKSPWRRGTETKIQDDVFGPIRQSIWKLLPMMFVCRWITYFSWLSFEWKRSKEKIFGMRWTVPAILFWDGEISFLPLFLGLKTWRRIMQPYKFLCIQMYSRRKCRCSKACLPGKERKITATQMHWFLFFLLYQRLAHPVNLWALCCKFYPVIFPRRIATAANNGLLLKDSWAKLLEPRKKNPGWLGYIGDYTTQLYRDSNKPL